MTNGHAALRVGAIGCGRHATTGVWPFLAPSGLRLVAACSRTIAHARDAAARFGVDHAFDDPVRMIEESSLDGLIIVLPLDAFAQAVTLAIERRIPAFVEKPGADNASEAYDLAARAHEANATIVVGYQRRFSAAYRRARALIAAPEFGPVSLASFRWAMGPYARRFPLRGWLVENPIHHFDLARYLFGDLHDLHVQVAEQRGEFVAVIGARAASGAVVSIRANTTSSWQQHNETVEVFGVGHSVVVDNMDTVVYRPPQGMEQRWRPNYTVPAAGHMSGELLGFGEELVHFRRAVREHVPIESDLANSAATMRLAEQVADLAR